MSTTTLFANVLSVAWSYLDTHSRQAVKASCRDGCSTYDSNWMHFRAVVGNPPGAAFGQHKAPAVPPDELAIELLAACARGARPHALSVELHNGEAAAHVREAQTLAILTRLAGPSITSVSLQGYLSITPAVAAAFSVTEMPELRSLSLRFGLHFNPEGHDRNGDCFADGVLELLHTASPQLQQLELLLAGSYYVLPVRALKPLEECTKLQQLKLDMGWHRNCSDKMTAHNVAEHESVLSTVGCLTSLRALDLYNGPTLPPEEALTLAPRLQELLRLTALTRLRLALHNYNHIRDLFLNSDPIQIYITEMQRAWDAHRASLASAVRCMPGLQRLILDGMMLGPQHLAQLTTVTRLELRGVLPAAASAERKTAAWGLRSIPLPPRLQELKLHSPPSPRHLAALVPPVCFRTLEVKETGESNAFQLSFGVPDVSKKSTWDRRSSSAERHLLGDVPATMEAAAAFLGNHAPWLCGQGQRRLSVSLGARPSTRLLPPEGAPDGHACWLRPLAALRLHSLRLEGLTLETQDIDGLVEALPELKRLELRWDTRLSPIALPRLGALRSLEELAMDLQVLQPCTTDTAVAVISSLFQRAAEARASTPGASTGTGGATLVAEPALAAVQTLLRLHIKASYYSNKPERVPDVVRELQRLLDAKLLPGELKYC